MNTRNLATRRLDTARVTLFYFTKQRPFLHSTGIAVVMQDHRTTRWEPMCVALIGVGELDMRSINVISETPDELRFEVKTSEYLSRRNLVPHRTLKVRVENLKSKVVLEN